jgi:hypothetical protein
MTAHDARTGEQIYGRRRIAVGTGFTAPPCVLVGPRAWETPGAADSNVAGLTGLGER